MYFLTCFELLITSQNYSCQNYNKENFSDIWVSFNCFGQFLDEKYEIWKKYFFQAASVLEFFKKNFIKIWKVLFYFEVIISIINTMTRIWPSRGSSIFIGCQHISSYAISTAAHSTATISTIHTFNRSPFRPRAISTACNFNHCSPRVIN